MAQFTNEVPENIKVPLWPELAVHKVWPQAIRLPGVLQRLPDEWDGGRRTDKQFFWTTVIGQHEDWVLDLIDNCTRQRRYRAVKTKEERRDNIPIRLDIAKMLISHEVGVQGKFEDDPVTLLFSYRS